MTDASLTPSPTPEPLAPVQQVAYRKLWWLWLAAGGIALLVNVLFLFNAARLMEIEVEIPLPWETHPVPLSAFHLAPVSFAAAGIGTLLLALLGRFTQRPFRWFLYISLGLLLVSFLYPLSLPVDPFVQFILCGLEVATAACVVGVLYTAGRADPAGS